MKNLIILGSVGVVLFAISGGLSLWLEHSRPAEKSPARDANKAEGAAEKDREAEPLRPLVRPDPVPDVSEAAKLKDDLNQGLDQIRERERELEEERSRTQLILEDLRAEQALVDRLRAQAESGRVTEIPPPPRDPDDTATADPKNFGDLAEIFDSTPPEQAAKILTQMSRNGQREMAVTLLTRMKARSVAKLLALVSETDPDLAAELVQKVGERSPPAGP